MTTYANRQDAPEVPHVRPPADIIQKDDSYYILLDMPGVNMKDIDISISNDVLTIEAETTYTRAEREKLLDNEFGDVHYTRRFTLSDSVDTEAIKAHLNNGLLKLLLPKAKRFQPKKIEIKGE
jgi:HSP20 family protein